jgi:hypothetical protein
MTDVAKHADAIFVGLDGDNIGKVVTAANPAGQRAIEQLFPGYHVAWREVGNVDWAVSLPSDWREYCFNIPSLLLLPNHGLNRRLLAMRPLEKTSPDQFAFLMMFGTNNQSVRAMFWSIAKRQFVNVNMPHQRN